MIRLRDYTPLLDEAIREAKAAGLAKETEELDRACSAAFTTSNELLHEHNLALGRFLKLHGPGLPRQTRAKLEACLNEIRLAFPGWRQLVALLRRSPLLDR